MKWSKIHTRIKRTDFDCQEKNRTGLGQNRGRYWDPNPDPNWYPDRNSILKNLELGLGLILKVSGIGIGIHFSSIEAAFYTSKIRKLVLR